MALAVTIVTFIDVDMIILMTMTGSMVLKMTMTTSVTFKITSDYDCDCATVDMIVKQYP